MRAREQQKQKKARTMQAAPTGSLAAGGDTLRFTGTLSNMSNSSSIGSTISNSGSRRRGQPLTLTRTAVLAPTTRAASVGATRGGNDVWATALRGLANTSKLALSDLVW